MFSVGGSQASVNDSAIPSPALSPRSAPAITVASVLNDGIILADGRNLPTFKVVTNSDQHSHHSIHPINNPTPLPPLRQPTTHHP